MLSYCFDNRNPVAPEIAYQSSVASLTCQCKWGAVSHCHQHYKQVQWLSPVMYLSIKSSFPGINARTGEINLFHQNSIGPSGQRSQLPHAVYIP